MAVKGLELVKSKNLYNLLQQGTGYPSLSDPNFLLLMDARKKNEYNESHILTARKAPKNEEGRFAVPYDAELECKQNVFVYDSNTSALTDARATAIIYGKLLWKMGSKNPVKIVKGGYEAFSALYPFLRTQKIIFMPRELDEIKTYPVEILHGSLYLGNWRQGNAAYIQKDLKIKAHVNVCVEAETFFTEPGDNLLHIQVEDSPEADLLSHFENACLFIDKRRTEDKAVLVFDSLGISRSVTVLIAYLMRANKWPLERAYGQIEKHLPGLRPNRSFVKQLSIWEEKLFGQSLTDIEDPNF